MHIDLSILNGSCAVLANQTTFDSFDSKTLKPRVCVCVVSNFIYAYRASVITANFAASNNSLTLLITETLRCADGRLVSDEHFLNHLSIS
jgi:hypothetical protein